MSELRHDGLIELDSIEAAGDGPDICGVCRLLTEDCACPQCVACGEVIKHGELSTCPCGMPTHKAQACVDQHYDEAHRDDEEHVEDYGDRYDYIRELEKDEAGR